MCNDSEKKEVQSFTERFKGYHRIDMLVSENENNIKDEIVPIKKPSCQTGIIYAFISESNPEYIKIGFSSNLLERLDNLNNSESTSSIEYKKYNFHYLCGFWGNELYEFEAQLELAQNGCHIEGEIFRCTYDEVKLLFSNLDEIDFKLYCENFSDNIDSRLSYRKKMFGK